MSQIQEVHFSEDFQEGTLVTYHFHNGNQSIPIPGVIVGQDIHDVVIRARIQGKIQEVRVNPEHLSVR
jgi:hypothetical protein